MARVQLLVVVALWLLVAGAVVRAWLNQSPHRHWMAGLETLRRWDHT